MSGMKIGMMVDSLRLPLEDGIKKAAEMGVEGLQIYAVSGEFCPDNLTPSRIKNIKSLIDGLGLSVSALCGDFGGHGLEDREENKWKIEKSKRVMDLALEMGTKVVTTHIGVVPEDITNPRYPIMMEACYELGRYGDEVGAKFAIETGPEAPETLKKFLDGIKSKSICVNYDPANLAMVIGCDPAEGVKTLSDYIVHTHAKDGKMLKKGDPEKIYGFFADGGIEDFRTSDYFIETPLGEGDVDFKLYIKALKAINYNGYLTIEREVGENPEHDIILAIKFLHELIK